MTASFPGASAGSRPRVRVLVLQQGLGPLDYALPKGWTLPPGAIVQVPLGPRLIAGVVWEADRMAAGEVEDAKLRAVASVYDIPPVSAAMRRLVEWAADYYLASPAAVLRMVLASASALDGRRTVTEYRPTGQVPDRLTPRRAQALERLQGRQGLIRELALIAEVSDAVIRGLVKAGAIEPVEVSVDMPFPAPDPDFAPPLLEAGQRLAADSLRDAVATGGFQPFLLDGVTGSGKTEVYFEAIAEALADGGQILVLVPEIALTEPWLRRFEARFGVAPVAWHSDLRATERRRAWHAAASGEARVIVGARSALFLPCPRLRLIIVDEAHETSFKQEEGVMYHARDVAVMRAQIEKLPVVLATATPAIETRVQVERGRYAHIALPSRYGGAVLPDIRTIDMRQFPPPPGRWLSPLMVKALEETLARGEQALLFLNRRGYAPLTLCRSCGHRIECPNCTAWMVEHRLLHRLQCHQCGHAMPVPDSCPECRSEGTLVACGPGVERIADEVAAILPLARTAIVASDTIWSPAKAAALVNSVENHEFNLLIGTQLITKGYHFPDLTLVGVVDADLGLAGGDLRASERTFQQIQQVAGRAGRAEKPGHVLLQTHQPEASVIRALVSGDSEGFYAAETESRRQHAMPPFGRLAGIIISSEDQREAAETARMIGAAAPMIDGVTILGPAPAPLSLLRGRYRQRLLVHARRTVYIQSIIRDWLSALQWPRGVRVAVDVDPYSFV